MNGPFSVIILAYNERANIEACLASLAGLDDIHVLDSGSTDGTPDLARLLGAQVYRNPFESFGQQRNWAIDNIPAKYDWHFHLDADERMTPGLAAELAAVAAADPPAGGYRVPSKLMFAGRWLRWAGQYPGYQVRFFHRRRLRFADHGHGQRESTAHPVGTLRQPLIHHAFSKGLDHWFAKHIGYARREAEQALAASTETARFWSRDSTQRRRALKRLAARLPFRYFLRLNYMLFWRLAFLDGWAGMTYAHMLATYESMIDVYIRLLRRGTDLQTELPYQQVNQ